MRFTVFLVLLVLSGNLHAQQLPLETYTPANGLVDARITKMFQDSRGRIYFLTREGFSIFDGQHFDNYGNEGAGRTEMINGIAEYPGQLVKLFSFDGNIYSVNGNKITIDTTHRKLLSEVNNVIDLAPDDKIIVTNYYMVREKKGAYKKLSLPFATTALPHIENILLYKPFLIISQFINSTQKNIYLYNYETQQVIDMQEGIYFMESIADRKNNLFIRNSAWMQLDKEALHTGKIKFSEAGISKKIPPDFKGTRLFFDANNNAWFSRTDKGYCRVSDSGSVINFLTSADGIVGNANFIFQDAEKNIWLVSTGDGVQKIQQSPLLKFNTAGTNPLNYVRSINTDEEGGNFIHALNGYYLNNKKIQVKSSLSNTPVFYWQKQYWQFTDYKTLTGSGGTIFHLDNYFKPYKPEDLQQSFTTVDREGRLVIAGSKIFTIDKQLNLYAYKPDYFCDNVVVDETNNYWLFLRNNVVTVLKWQNNKLIPFYNKTFTTLNPRYALQWDTNTFAVGTRVEGIKFFTRKNNELFQSGSISKKNGLSNNFINVLFKKNGQLIAGTGAGLDIINIDKGDTTVENLAVRNNIFSPFANIVALRDSSLLCLTADGQLYQLASNTKLTSQFTPRVFFKSILVDNDPADSSAVFPYTKNNFSFSVSAPSFLDNKNMRYHFMLTGNEQQWQQNTTSADFNINNLLPGKYTLKVTVQYPGKFYPGQSIQYSFTIKNPFWKQWWFILLAVLAVLATVFLFVRNYYKRKFEKQRIAVEKQQAVEKERTRIATDMHDDFGASLSRIKFLSEKLQLQKNDGAKTNEDLGKISAYSDEMAEKMGEIVWALNQRYDSSGDLVSFCRSYASEYLEGKNIKLIFNTAEIADVKINGEIRRNIFLVMKEALHNVVKHAAASEINISITCDETLELFIGDNGKGFDTDNFRPFANGIANMKKRIEEINGSFSIQNNNGTQIRISVKSGIHRNTY